MAIQKFCTRLQYNQSMNNRIAILLTIVTLASSLKFTVNLEGLQRQCFYQVLDSQQKYSVDAVPRNDLKYEVEITNMQDGKWNTIFFKQTESPYQGVSVHKFASIASTYSICVKNNERGILKVNLNIQSGLELMEFELLPNKGDSENLNRQLNWIDSQKNVLFESLSRMEGLRASTEGITNIMSTKMIAFAILGLASIVVVNFLFYRQLKKTFKERKLI